MTFNYEMVLTESFQPKGVHEVITAKKMMELLKNVTFFG